MSLLKLKIGNKVYLAKYESPKPTVTIGGRKYPIVQIGRQWWITDNLDYYDENISVGGDSSITAKRAYYYDNDPTTYGWDGLRQGLLYNVNSLNYLVANESTIFPDGWRIPSNNDVSNLINAAGGSSNAGDILSKGSLDWAPEWTGTNTFNFSLCPSGSRYGSDGNFHDIGDTGQFWSRTAYQNYRNAGSSVFYVTGPQANYSASAPIRLRKDATVNIGGRDYPTTRIGNQVWLAENLDLKWDGLNVGESGTSSEEPRANYYNNDESTYGVTGNKYGLLYNWQAANYLDEHRALLLPKGWRVPSTSDWNVLANEIGGMNTAGIKLRSSTGWSYINGIAGGTDNYGFTSIPSGAYDGNSVNADWCSMYWGTTLVTDDMANNFIIDRQQPLIVGEGYLYGQFSIRLVKDAT